MAKGQKSAVFPVLLGVESNVANRHLAVCGAAAFGRGIINRAEDITANATHHPLTLRNESLITNARTPNRPAANSTRVVTTSPITIVSSMFCTLKLSANIGHLCGSTDDPVCL